jgi:putative PEP-CTERM system histidine kinase
VIELTGEAARPDCLAEIADAWLAVPLSHLGRLLGFVVLTEPRAPLRLDREVFDLLRILGRQAGAHAAEWQHFRAILESRSLREFGKNFAFAVHDMKNVASQLSMIVQNAERAGDDPEFYRDVLATVEAALGRTNGLIERLRSRPTPATSATAAPLDLVEEEIAAIRRTRGAQIELRHDGGRAVVAADGGLLRGVIAHLCDNAIEASDGRAAVSVCHEPSRVLIDIADSGHGMTAEFVRDQLFAPFGSTKGSGLGIGAYQARDMKPGRRPACPQPSRPRHHDAHHAAVRRASNRWASNRRAARRRAANQ